MLLQLVVAMHVCGTVSLSWLCMACAGQREGHIVGSLHVYPNRCCSAILESNCMALADSKSLRGAEKTGTDWMSPVMCLHCGCEAVHARGRVTIPPCDLPLCRADDTCDRGVEIVPSPGNTYDNYVATTTPKPVVSGGGAMPDGSAVRVCTVLAGSRHVCCRLQAALLTTRSRVQV